MLKSLQDFFSAKLAQGDSKPKDTDIQLAAATLMFELIRSDGVIDDVERDKMTQILRDQFNLQQEDVDSIYELAKQSAEESISLHSFTRPICERWGVTEREQLIENLWVLALADSIIDAHERHLVRKVAGLLHLNDAQIAKAREKAKRSMQSTT